MKFCPNCNFMLYPIEDSTEKKLKFKCNYCNQVSSVEENDEIQNTVFTNEIKLSQIRKAIDPDVVNDPTYSRTKNTECPSCYHTEAIYFHDTTRENSGMKLIMVCCRKDCGNSWENNN